MRLTDLLQDPIGAISGQETVSERQERQFGVACLSLDAAGEALVADDPDYQAVIATALVGLLAAQLSKG